MTSESNDTLSEFWLNMNEKLYEGNDNIIVMWLKVHEFKFWKQPLV